jgi:hypothetical protein
MDNCDLEAGFHSGARSRCSRLVKSRVEAAQGSWKAAELADSLAPLTAKNSSSETLPIAWLGLAVNHAAQFAQESPCQESAPNHFSV